MHPLTARRLLLFSTVAAVAMTATSSNAYVDTLFLIGAYPSFYWYAINNIDANDLRIFGGNGFADDQPIVVNGTRQYVGSNRLSIFENGTWIDGIPVIPSDSSAAWVWDIVNFNSSIVVVGLFNGFPSYEPGSNDTYSRNVIRFDGVHWHAFASGIPDSSGYGCRVSAIFNGTVWAACALTTAYAWNITSQSWYQTAVVDGNINAMAEFSGQMFIGGTFTTVNSIAGFQNIAAWNGTAWSAVSGGLPSGPTPPASGVAGVTGMAVYNGELVVGGTDLNATGWGLNSTCVMAWNSIVWRPLFRCDGIASTVNGLAVYKGYLYVSGCMNTGQAGACYTLLRFHGATSTGLMTTPNFGRMAAMTFPAAPGPPSSASLTSPKTALLTTLMALSVAVVFAYFS